MSSEGSSAPVGAFVAVAVPVPGLPLLTYRVPPDSPTPVRGARVLVPLGARTVTGCIAAVAVPAPAGDGGDVRDVVELLDHEPFLPDAIVDLALWVADYYMAGPGDAIASAMPPRAWVSSERKYVLTADGRQALHRLEPDDARAALLNGLAGKGGKSRREIAAAIGASRADRTVRDAERDGLIELVQPAPGGATAFRTEQVAALTVAGHAVVDAGAAGQRTLTPPLGDRQIAALAALAGSAEGRGAADLRERGVALDTLRRLAARGLVLIRRERVERDPFESGAGGPALAPASPRALTSEQAAAFEQLIAQLETRRFQATLLQGVTGSGKTELYLRLAGAAIAGGRRVLVLVPEIALTPQVASQFRAAFGARVAIQHSALADGERHDQWHRIRRGEIDLVVGTRSAVFAPLDRLGLIVVDEEHDSSYKQEELPRYNGRDVAVMRAREAGALVVLGSATPSLESAFNAMQNRYARVVLTRRVLDRPLAGVRVIDLRQAYAEEGPEVVLSAPLVEAIQRRLDRGEQTLLLLNRRGYATAVLCRQCGHTLECPNCSVSLTVHGRGPGARAVCHYCNYSMRVPPACVKCAAPYLEQLGFGTQRVLAEVERLWPAARAGRVDRDTMRKRGAIQRVLERFGRGELDLLVGTQMIAKGHDFPRVTLVGVVSADLGLGLADFRAAERTFQLLTQVAGRAGRGTAAGEAIIQTIHPDHYSIRLACRQDYDAFLAEELRYRAAMRYPPAVGLVNVVVRGRTFAGVMQDAQDLALRLQRAPAGQFAVLGPAPAPLARLRGEYRAQMFLKTRARQAAKAALASALDDLPELRRRVIVDVDPVGLL